mmetsp:Transcript_11653/g.14533  ORF Transcript_11653/g.14533 Transcript_11653/m.14533 type:complete len:95 (-) Transcript_11653:523-807(-)
MKYTEIEQIDQFLDEKEKNMDEEENFVAFFTRSENEDDNHSRECSISSSNVPDDVISFASMSSDEDDCMNVRMSIPTTLAHSIGESLHHHEEAQ